MEPLTHALIGGALYKLTGGDISLTNPQFIAITLGAISPDIDIIFKRWGNYQYYKNHRGISHSTIGLISISLVLGLISPSTYFSTFLFALLGCISHTLFDILNSHGAKVLWPFVRRKVSTNILGLFDPVVVILSSLIMFSPLYTNAFAIIFLIYIILRVICKIILKQHLSKKYAVNFKKAIVIPSFANIVKWNFIIRYNNYSVVGGINMIGFKTRIIKRFYKTEEHIEEIASKTKLGKFFKDFAPIYSIAYENRDNKNIITFTDIKHHFCGNFIHHGTLVLDNDFEISEQIFNPYSLNKKVYL